MAGAFNFREYLTFDPEEGQITFRGSRMLLFNASALFALREELVQSLGDDLARGVLTRFGYRCGLQDVRDARNIFELGVSDRDWLQAGALLHTWEGLVRATYEEARFDRQSGHFYLRGYWHNSFEADQFLKHYGAGAGAACWVLAGYTSGFTSGFLGRELLCVETGCRARGDAYCQFEVRPPEEWGAAVNSRREELRPVQVVKSLQLLLHEEQERVERWKALGEACAAVAAGGKSEEVLDRFLRQLRVLLGAREAALALRWPDEETYRLYRQEAGRLTYQEAGGPDAWWQALLAQGQPLREEIERPGGWVHVLGVPLSARGEMLGAVAVAGRERGGFGRTDLELLRTLAEFFAIALENAHLFEQTDRRLQQKVDELERLNDELQGERRALQRSLEVHERLTRLVLEGGGCAAVCRALSAMVHNPVLVEDAGGQLLGASAAELPPHFSLAGQEGREEGELRRRAGEAGGCDQVALPVVAAGETLGYLYVLEQNEPLNAQGEVAVRHAATALALELWQQRAARRSVARKKKELLIELLEGNVPADLVERSAQLGFLQQPARLAVLEAEGGLPEEAESLLQAAGRESLALRCQGQLLVLAEGEEVVALPARQWLAGLRAGLAGKAGVTVWAVAGRVLRRPAEVAAAYAECREFLLAIRALERPDRMLALEEIGALGLITPQAERLAEFGRRVLGPLVEYDRQHDSGLVEALGLFYRHQGNLQQAARAGFLSPSTLKYRLRRVREVAGIDPREPGPSLELQLALKLYR